jgi:hypothetical protein
MKPLKIVIIYRFTIPCLAPRVFRATELAKELSRKGHNVYFYTMLSNYDYSSITQTGVVLKNLGSSVLGLEDSNGNPPKGFIYKILKKIFGRLLAYPSIMLMPMVKKAIEQEGDIDYLITIAVPHPIHWGASYAKMNKVKCWTADCGDPFMLNPMTWHPFYFKWIEKKWCKKADFITVPIEEAKMGYYKNFRDKIRVIPQGFDFSNLSLSEYHRNIVPTFAYSGNLYKNGRDISSFLNYLCTLQVDFKFIVYTMSLSFFIPFKDRLGEKLDLRDYIPREVLLKKLSTMDFLINVKNDTAIQKPSKLIDYFLSKRPILEITSSFNEKESFEEFLNGEYRRKLKDIDISEYDISNVSNKFIDLYFEKINR